MDIHAPTLSGFDTTKKLDADLPVNATLHIWMKAVDPTIPGSISFTSPRGKFGEVNVNNAEEYEFRIYQVYGGGHIELDYDIGKTAVSVIYWFTPSDVLETGITVLHTNPGNAPPNIHGGYHFRPPFGWMNDPNGFGRFDGRPHLFYQHYSHGLTWNTMHWGHAVSSDYLRWRHLPIFLFPSESLTARPDKRGGAFSGSAISLPDGPGIRVFFTEQELGRAPEPQIQLTATSPDLIMAGQAEIIVAVRPEGRGLTQDFRDPYVFKGPDGRWKMLLGSHSADGGAILLYETDDHTAAGGWRFANLLLLDPRLETQAIECPCLIPLGGSVTDPTTRWCLIYGLMHSHEPSTGRRNLSIAAVGWFDGREFHKEFEQELDFGTDNYAFQAFVDGDTAIGIGWLGNWADTGPAIDFPTAMTLPRKLVLAGSALLTPPIGPVESLRSHILDRTRLAHGDQVSLSSSAVEIQFELSAPGSQFELELGHPGVRLSVRQDEHGLAIGHEVEGAVASPHYIARGAKASRFRVFLDFGSIEVFADNGRWVGTKRLNGFAPMTSARLAAAPGVISHATLWALKL